jgi:hypothetical protein
VSRAKVRAAHPPDLDEWLCIHSHEAGWSNRDGGLQMSFDFIKGYAGRAWQVRGFQPWPATARMCALL